MKKRCIIAIFLVVALLILSFAGCEKVPERAEEPEPIEGPKLADLKATDSLVIYKLGGGTQVDRWINQFTKIYDVDVEVVSVDGGRPEYTERVMNDLVGGSGPDVLFVENLYSSDIAKIAMYGNLLDLTDVLASDPDFSEEEYVEGVFEAGQFNGRQYVIPLSFEAPILLSSTEKLEKIGFDWNNIETTADFVENMGLLTPEAEQTVGFAQMLDSKNRFYQLLINSGVSLVDYETGEVLPDEEGLREFLEGYKAYFPYDYDETVGTFITNYGHEELLSGKWVFWYPTITSDLLQSISAMKNESCDYTLHLIPSQTGETVANIRSWAMAIRANTKNSLNAYNFIKLMLSEDIQSDESMFPSYMPIHKEAIRKIVHETYAVNIVNGYAVPDYERRALSDEEAEMVIEMLTGIDRFALGLPVMSSMVQESMLPFFRDEKSYDDCLSELRSQLTFYMSE